LDDPLDISVRTKHKRGYLHLIAQERRHIERVAQHLGMRIEYGHELVTKYENFASVNIPDHHPAVEMHDTIYVDHPYVEEDLLLRTHTSAQQVAYLQEYETPLSLLSIGRVYRHEKLDATHDSAFWQIEGMVVDRGITVEHCVSFLQEFLDAIFGEHFRIRVRPAYFPFVEPGFEIDVNYAMGSQSGDDHRVELLGAGMIHPHILTEAGVNPETHSGFAFGIGLSRLVAIKHQIKDIRLFTNGDMRFVQSF
jgi:phenylalanyl-tRNA synthetase alpha chain